MTDISMVARWWGALDPHKPLEPGWYVDFDAWDHPDSNRPLPLRGQPVVPLMRRTIALATEEGIASTQLFTGFRGSGKTTELLKLAAALRSEHTVLHFDARDYLSFTRAHTAEELALALAAGIGEAAADVLGAPSPVKKQTLWQAIKDLLTKEAELTEVKLGLGGLADIKLQLQHGGDFRAKLGAIFQARPEALKDFLHNTVVRPIIASQRPRPVVIIVDGLEKYDVPYTEAGQVYRAIAQLYAQQADLFALPDCHTIYAVPPLVAALDRSVEKIYGSAIRTLTSVKLHQRPPSRAPCAPGEAALASALRKRVDTAALFGPDDNACVQALVRASGGHVRDLLWLSREVITRHAELPISLDDVKAVIQWEAGRSEIGTKAVDALLTHVDAGGGLRDLTEDQLGALAIALDQYLILGYANGRVWYDVHPLARAAEPE